MKVRKLQSRTSRGVRIGDNESQIVSRLGRPNKIERAGNQIRVFRYGQGASATGRSYDEAYIFRAGQLVEIQIRANQADEDED